MRQGLTQPKPRYGDRQSDKADSSQFNPLNVVASQLVVLAVMRLRF
jgi:hypothetical protein